MGPTIVTTATKMTPRTTTIKTTTKSTFLGCDTIELKLVCIEENNSVSSVAEELNFCKLIHTDVKCSSYDETFITRNDLKHHLNAHVTQREESIKSQTIEFASSVGKLIKKEYSELRKPCMCERFSRINHTKHNWKNSKSSDIITKFERIQVDDGQSYETIWG